MKETKARRNGQTTKNHTTRIMRYRSAGGCFEKTYRFKNVKIPKVLILGFQVLFLWQFYTDHIYIHILIEICEFCCNLDLCL